MKKFTHNKKILFSLITVITISILGFMASCDNSTSSKNKPISISSIEFMPNSYYKEGKIVGVDIDITAKIMKSIGQKYEINVSENWDEAYNATLAGPNKALLTIGYSKERQDLFKWAGPISKGAYSILVKSKTGIGTAIGIEAAKNISSIACVTGWLETTSLEGLGFANLIYYNSYNDALNAFKNDEVVAIASDFFHFKGSLPENYYQQEDVLVASRYRTVFYYIAFSKDVDDNIIRDCQKEIDRMKENQELFSITQNHIPYALESMVPGKLQLFTEPAAPFNYLGNLDGVNVTLNGSSIEMVEELQSRNAKTDAVILTSWTDGYSLAQYLPNCALFTVARTEERENLFQWVGPIASLNAHFYTKTESGISIETLDQAKSIQSIATPNSWYTHEFLIENNFQNIVATSFTPDEAFKQFINNEVDAILMYDTGMKWLCDKYNYPTSVIDEQLQINSSTGYIAFSLNTPQSIVQEWQNSLDQMKSDGTFETIWLKWFEGIEQP